MAQRVLVQLVSDLTGEEIAEGKGETVSFGLDGTSYEIDVTKKEADALRKALATYIDAGRKVTSTRRRSSGNSRRGGSEDLAAMREWGKANGFKVSERGRVSQDLRDAYAAAN